MQRNAPSAPSQFQHLSTAPTSLTLRVSSQDTPNGSDKEIDDAFFHFLFVKREKFLQAIPLPAHDHFILASDLIRRVRARVKECIQVQDEYRTCSTTGYYPATASRPDSSDILRNGD